MTPEILIPCAIVLFILLLLALKYKALGDLIGAVGGIIAVVVGILLLALLFAVPIMWLWDYTMPYLFKVPEITLGRAFCLALLCKMLFGGSSSKKE